jgi:hypothetical protein
LSAARSSLESTPLAYRLPRVYRQFRRWHDEVESDTQRVRFNDNQDGRW